jgi:WD40 repeat protein
MIISAVSVLVLTGLTGQPEGRLRSLGDVNAAVSRLTFSPNGRHLAVGASPTILIWDLVTGQRGAIRVATEEITSLVLSSDGKTLAFTDRKRDKEAVIYVWQYSLDAKGFSAREVAKLRGHDEQILALSFSPDGMRLASTAEFPDKKSRVWDISMGQTVFTLPASHEAGCIAFSPDKKLLVTGDFTVIRIWNAADGKHIADLKSDIARVGSLSFSLDGALLAAGGSGLIQVWEMNGYRDRSRIKSEGGNAAAMSPPRRYLATATRKDIRILSVDHGAELLKIDGGAPVAFSPDGKQMALARGREVVLRELTDLKIEEKSPRR